MNASKVPVSLWRPDYLAVAVETVARGYRRLPLSCSWAVVRGGRVTSVHHQPVAWWSPGEVGEDGSQGRRRVGGDPLPDCC